MLAFCNWDVGRVDAGTGDVAGWDEGDAAEVAI